MLRAQPFDNDSVIIGESIELGMNFSIGKNTEIRATHFFAGDNVSIGDRNSFLVGETLSIGDNSVMGSDNYLTGRSMSLGEYVYWGNRVIVGHGGCFGPKSTLTVGSYSMVCDRVTLNLSDAVVIGDWVGIGDDVAIWTHGSFLPILEGFPADFGPVTIGNKVWLPARSIVLPNRKIGNNVVIGIASLVNTDIPDGAFAAGQPARILRQDLYPRVDREVNAQQIDAILADYESIRDYKHVSSTVHYSAETNTIRCNEVLFQLDDMTIEGVLGPEEQDFRDHLRRRGIKFYNGDPFLSILPAEYQALLQFVAERP